MVIVTTLPIDSNERKDYPLSRGCYAYFPAALAGIAKHSAIAGAKHTGGELVHNRWLSNDHEDCIERHMSDLRDFLAQLARGQFEPANVDGADWLVGKILSEANALAWRACALSQTLHEDLGGAPLAPAARLAPPEARADEHEQETFHPLPPNVSPIEPVPQIPEAWAYSRPQVSASD